MNSFLSRLSKVTGFNNASVAMSIAFFSAGPTFLVGADAFWLPLPPLLCVSTSRVSNMQKYLRSERDRLSVAHLGCRVYSVNCQGET